jgi:hypothetical protein
MLRPSPRQRDRNGPEESKGAEAKDKSGHRDGSETGDRLGPGWGLGGDRGGLWGLGVGRGRGIKK